MLARVVPNGFGFGLARTVLRPSARPSRAVQRRPPEAQRSGTTGRSQPNGEPAGFFTGRLANDRCQEEDGEYGHGTQGHVTMEHAGETKEVWSLELGHLVQRQELDPLWARRCPLY